MEDTVEETTVPLGYVNSLLDSISEILRNFRVEEIKEGLVKDVKEIITSQVDNITDEDVETLEISQLTNLLNKLKHFGSLSENDDKEMEEMMELKLYHKLVRCPIFKRKRQGMVNLVNIANDLDDNSKSTRSMFRGRSKKNYEYLDLDMFLGWIKDNKLIDYVFGEYSHPEIIRKSGELLQKMCQKGYFKKKEVDLLWSVFNSNFHEDILAATLDVIEMIALSCENDVLKDIRDRIHSYDKDEYDLPFINFIKQFILSEMRNFNENDAPKKGGGVGSKIKKMLFLGNSNDPEAVMTKEHVEWINKDIMILWKLPSERGIPDNVKAQAFKVIPEILSDENCSDKTRENYIDMAKKGLKSADNIYNNLSFIKALLANAGGFAEVKKIVKEYNITEIILMAADSYLSKVKKLFREPYDFNNIKSIEKHIKEKDSDLLEGRSHRDHLEKIFDILQYILDKSYNGSPFSEKEVEKMFQIFVSKRISNFESETLFEFILNDRTSSSV